jgi:hypothetical protein
MKSPAQLNGDRSGRRTWLARRKDETRAEIMTVSHPFTWRKSHCAEPCCLGLGVLSLLNDLGSSCLSVS